MNVGREELEHPVLILKRAHRHLEALVELRALGPLPGRADLEAVVRGVGQAALALADEARDEGARLGDRCEDDVEGVRDLVAADDARGARDELAGVGRTRAGRSWPGAASAGPGQKPSAGARPRDGREGSYALELPRSAEGYPPLPGARCPQIPPPRSSPPARARPARRSSSAMNGRGATTRAESC